MFSSYYNNCVYKVKGEVAGQMMQGADEKGEKIMGEKRILLTLDNVHSEGEYQTKKTNTRLRVEHCVQLYPEHELSVEGSWKGEGKIHQS